MGPDEQSTSKYGMVIAPINEDGTYGEPIKFENLQPISDLQFYIDNKVYLSDKELNKRYSNEKNKPLLAASWSGEFNAKFRHQKISKKTFKKWCMSRGLSRNASELACQIVGFNRGKISYQKVYLANIFAPQSYLYIEGATKQWTKK